MKALFLGDLSPTVDNFHLFEQGDLDTLFADTLPLFANNDVNMVNLECALTEHDTPIQKIGPALKAPPAAAEVMRRVGVTHCGIANNHFFDFGKKGAADTLAALDAAGIGYPGFGENETDSRRDLILEKNGVKADIQYIDTWENLVELAVGGNADICILPEPYLTEVLARTNSQQKEEETTAEADRGTCLRTGMCRV